MSQAGAHVRVERDASTWLVTLDRPDKKNALDLQMYRDLAAVLLAADRDDAVRSVIVAGQGSTFTAGNDLRDFLAKGRDQLEGPIVGLLDVLAAARKPMLCAVEGAAVGIGATLLLHADLVVASHDAFLSFPFVDLGLVPEAGSTVLLPAVVGRLRARELLLLAERIPAARAAELGLVTRVVAPGTALAEARALADRLAEKSAPALLATRALLRAAEQGRVEQAIRREADAFLDLLATPAVQDRIAAFFKRR